jgi:enoyl-CoA hydratase
MSDFFTVLHEPDTGIATLELNQPARMNTLTPAFFPALRDAVQRLSDEGQTRVLVVQSTGKHFSAGMALEVFATQADWLSLRSARDRLSFQDHLRRLMGCFDAIDEARFPVICAVQGACVGGALDLAAACDIRVCSADAFFTVQEIHIGMAADLGVLQRLQRIVPQGLAREMAYTGERLHATRALASGLVNAVLPDVESLHAHARQLAHGIASKSPPAVTGSKRALNYARDHGTREALDQMVLLQSAIFDIEEMARAIQAWKSKQPVDFAALSPVTDI